MFFIDEYKLCRHFLKDVKYRPVEKAKSLTSCLVRDRMIKSRMYLFFSVTAAEFINATCSIYQFNFTGVKRMAHVRDL